jgi:hypothetical protein
MKNLHAKRGRLPVLALGLALAMALGACHHNDDDDHGSKPPVSETPPPTTMTDAFFAYVSQIVATLSDTAEPASTDGVAATAPDNTEPQPLPAS